MSERKSQYPPNPHEVWLRAQRTIYAKQHNGESPPDGWIPPNPYIPPPPQAGATIEHGGQQYDEEDDDDDENEHEETKSEGQKSLESNDVQDVNLIDDLAELDDGTEVVVHDAPLMETQGTVVHPVTEVVADKPPAPGEDLQPIASEVIAVSSAHDVITAGAPATQPPANTDEFQTQSGMASREQSVADREQSVAEKEQPAPPTPITTVKTPAVAADNSVAVEPLTGGPQSSDQSDEVPSSPGSARRRSTFGSALAKGVGSLKSSLLNRRKSASKSSPQTPVGDRKTPAVGGDKPSNETTTMVEKPAVTPSPPPAEEQSIQVNTEIQKLEERSKAAKPIMPVAPVAPEPTHVTLNVRTLAGKVFTLEKLERNMTFFELKDLIQPQVQNIPPEEQKLLYKGKPITNTPNATTIKELGFKEGDFIHVVRQLAGLRKETTKPSAPADTPSPPAQADSNPSSPAPQPPSQPQQQQFNNNSVGVSVSPPQLITVLVPPGRGPGDRLRIHPNGRGPMLVSVPEGVFEGMPFRVQLPPLDPNAPAPTPQPQQQQQRLQQQQQQQQQQRSSQFQQPPPPQQQQYPPQGRMPPNNMMHGSHLGGQMPPHLSNLGNQMPGNRPSNMGGYSAPPQQQPPPQQPGGQLMAVTVPPGYGSGMAMDIMVPNYGRMRVVVPQGVSPGMQFRFRLPG